MFCVVLNCLHQHSPDRMLPAAQLGSTLSEIAPSIIEPANEACFIKILPAICCTSETEIYSRHVRVIAPSLDMHRVSRFYQCEVINLKEKKKKPRIRITVELKWSRLRVLRIQILFSVKRIQKAQIRRTRVLFFHMPER